MSVENTVRPLDMCRKEPQISFILLKIWKPSDNPNFSFYLYFMLI